MVNKISAVFVVCLVVLLATTPSLVVVAEDDSYAICLKGCLDNCKAAGSGNSFCEMRCDGKCLAKEAAGIIVGRSNALILKRSRSKGAA
ncbi:hypothetical protein Syun_007311 [Stephania yunnanensis]|uniref:Uncharacterized protein n=1 Tax=Stephania yunnanensis TaxID=152371 RepID=A0AAP0KZA4_9MAGN